MSVSYVLFSRASQFNKDDLFQTIRVQHYVWSLICYTNMYRERDWIFSEIDLYFPVCCGAEKRGERIPCRCTSRPFGTGIICGTELNREEFHLRWRRIVTVKTAL